MMTPAPRRYVRVTLMEFTTEVQKHYPEFIAWLDGYSGLAAKRVPVNSAPEFLALRKLLKRKAIDLNTSLVYTP